MRNKTKLAKQKNQRQQDKKQKTPGDWLYLLPEPKELAAIKEVLEADYSVEYWEAAGVLEVQLSETSMDFETVEMKRADEATKVYLKENGIYTVFLVSVVPDAFEEAEKVMKKLIASAGGYFCGDTADFTPVVR